MDDKDKDIDYEYYDPYLHPMTDTEDHSLKALGLFVGAAILGLVAYFTQK